MPDIFLYQSEANVYTILLSDPTTSHSGSSVSVSVVGTAIALFLGIVSANAGINVNLSGNIIASTVGRIAVMSTKPKINVGRGTTGSDRKRKRRIGEMFSL
jgi:hypothetical protein